MTSTKTTAKLWLCPQITDSFTIVDIAEKCIPPSWSKIFLQALPELKDIQEILNERATTFYPPKPLLFRAFELTPLTSVKVVIFGQDPYHTVSSFTGRPIAQGLAFSVSKKDKIPPSLRNIFTELLNSIPEFKMPIHGDLSSWAKQGVLLCNTCLTVDPGKAGSHGELWMGFIRQVIQAIVEQNKNVIFVLWGAKAQKLEKLIGNNAKILTAGHPSPFSVKHFYGCNHFKLINQHLIEYGKDPINWNL